MTTVSTVIRLYNPSCLGGTVLPHRDHIMPLIEATLICHGKVIVIPSNANNSHSCQRITYAALAYYAKKGTTVIIG